MIKNMNSFHPKYYMVFDVESVGLHGEGFAVGWVVIDTRGKEITAMMHACASIKCNGSESGHAWVKENVPNFEVNCENPSQVRNYFWHEWMLWKNKGAQLFADCAWPVEARFLIQCVEENMIQREWEGPYPLHDIASYTMPLGNDPLATHERLPSELPIHNPLCDARQSARILFESFHRRDEACEALL